jgi:O-antigen/teichoic acid export membrane protein
MILNGLFLRIKLFHVFKLISSLLIQLSSILLIFKLAPQDLGVYTLILSISQLLFTIISAWNGGGILFFGTKFFKLKGSYSIIVFYRFIIIISCAILVFLLVYFTKDTLSKFLLNSTNLKLALYLFFGLFFYDFSSQLLYPSNRDRIQSVIELIYSIILLTSTYYLVKNITDYVTYFCFISGAFSIVIVIILLKYMPLNITEIKKVDFKKVQEIISKNWLGRNHQMYQPLGELIIEMDHDNLKHKKYKRTLDLKLGIAQTTYEINKTQFTKSYFCSGIGYITYTN